MSLSSSRGSRSPCWWYGFCPFCRLPRSMVPRTALTPCPQPWGHQLPAVILYILGILGSVAIPCPSICNPFSGDSTFVPQKCLSELSRCAVSLGAPRGLCSPSPDTFVLKVQHRLQQHINLPFHIPAPKAQVLRGLILLFQMACPDKMVVTMETAQSRDPSTGSSKLQRGSWGRPWAGCTAQPRRMLCLTVN